MAKQRKTTKQSGPDARSGQGAKGKGKGKARPARKAAKPKGAAEAKTPVGELEAAERRRLEAQLAAFAKLDFVETRAVFVGKCDELLGSIEAARPGHEFDETAHLSAELMWLWGRLGFPDAPIEYVAEDLRDGMGRLIRIRLGHPYGGADIWWPVAAYWGGVEGPVGFKGAVLVELAEKGGAHRADVVRRIVQWREAGRTRMPAHFAASVEATDVLFDLALLSRIEEGIVRCIVPAAGAAVPSRSVARRRKRRGGGKGDRPLTPKETEALQLYGQSNGSYAAVAKRLGIDRKSVWERIQRAFEKLGPIMTKDLKRPSGRGKAQALPLDRSGQVDVAGGGDGPAVLRENRRVRRDRR